MTEILICAVLAGAIGILCYLWYRKSKTKKIPSPASAQPVSPESTATLSGALAKTRQNFWGKLQSIWQNPSADHFEQLEELLYASDLGPSTTERLLSALRSQFSAGDPTNLENLRTFLRHEMLAILTPYAETTPLWEKAGPQVWMIIGVNGAGKTTTIGKLAHRLVRQEKKVLIAAGDTFRAAAGRQLKVWSERAQVEIFNPEGVLDPSAVAFEACQRARAKNFDVVIVDTAGRLHTQKNLMEELKKMKRVIAKVQADAPTEILLVLDASSGQNALVQAKTFTESLGVTGVILTKMDGTAKGGVALGVAQELQLPIKLVGLGEGIDDLALFSAGEFVNSIV